MAEAKIECPCPGTPHAEGGDTVVLRDRLDSVAGLAIKYATAQKTREMREAGQINDEGEPFDEASSWLLMAFMNHYYLMYGISSWSLLDAEGKPWPVRPANIRSFMEEHPSEALEVGNIADDLYVPQVLLPLATEASSSSRPGQTNGSISQKNGSSGKNRKRSTPSSTASTTTADTAETSPLSDGVSSSSPS